MNRLKGIVYDCIGWLAAKGPRQKAAVKKLLIVRVDEIGDFMLWHMFIEDIATSAPFKGYEIHFCGNQSTKSLFHTFDAQFVKQTHWIDKTRFKKEMLYRFTFLRNIYRQGFEVVINPTFSRDKRYDDAIVKAAAGEETIGMRANLETVAEYEQGYDRQLYTRLFDHPEKPVFEFYRNKLFTEFLVQGKLGRTGTKIDRALLPASPIQKPTQFFVVFPGSRSAKRIWPTENFVLVSNYLFETTGATAVVCGTGNDAPYIDSFCRQYRNKTVNLMGKTSLPEMVALFSEAQCLLSVDTGSVHLAAAAGCPVFGIFNGSQYKRFAPYPKEVAESFYAIYPDAVEAELKNSAVAKEKYEFVVDVPYASVPAEKVILAIDEWMNPSR